MIDIVYCSYFLLLWVISSVPGTEFHCYSNQIILFCNNYKYHFLVSFQLIYWKKYVFTNNKFINIRFVMGFNRTWNSNSNNTLFCSDLYHVHILFHLFNNYINVTLFIPLLLTRNSVCINKKDLYTFLVCGFW